MVWFDLPLQSNQGASALAVVFHTLNIFFGLSGNLLTLLSIPYARLQRRFGFQVRKNAIIKLD